LRTPRLRRTAKFELGFALAAMTGLSALPVAASNRLFKQDGWLLAIKNDAFTGQTTCELFSTNDHMRYQPGAIGFFVGRRRGAFEAWYRVDDGVPVRWQDRSAALIATGVRIDSLNLDDTTDGWVWIPIAEVQHARLVAVRSGERPHIHRFRVRGFAAMREAAGRLGCGTDASFRS